MSRINDFYDFPDGNFMYHNLNIDHDGEHFHTVTLPETPAHWIINSLSWSKDHGIGLINDVKYSTVRPLDFYCEVPKQIHRGECVGKLKTESIYHFKTYLIQE